MFDEMSSGIKNSMKNFRSLRQLLLGEKKPVRKREARSKKKRDRERKNAVNRGHAHYVQPTTPKGNACASLGPKMNLYVCSLFKKILLFNQISNQSCCCCIT